MKLETLERELRLYQYLDVVGQPDYALWSAGGRVVGQLTSPTYVPHPRWWKRVWNSELTHLRPTELAITPDNRAGNCWPMHGSHGSLGVKLVEDIAPRSITVEHLSRHLAYRNDTAPKQISVWGLQPIRGRRHTGNLYVTKGLYLSIEHGLPHLHPEYYYRDFVLLGNLTYDILADTPIQTLELIREVEELDLFMDTLLFVFENNWGNGDYTCIYRVRVHGKSLGKSFT